MQFELTPLQAGDIDPLHRLYQRWAEHWNDPFVISREELESELADPRLDLVDDTRGVWLGGDLVAAGFVSHEPSGQRLERAFLPGKVDPAHRRRGIGTALLSWQLDRAASRLGGCDPSLPWFVRTSEWDWVEDAHRLYRRAGLEPVRWFEELILDLDRTVPVPAPPPGVEIRGWMDATDEESRQVMNAAFADHWGSTPRDPAAWKRVLNRPGVRTDLSFVARAGADLIGCCLNAHHPQDEDKTGRRDGWIDMLGVHAEWRRRGVARALIGASLRTFRDAGFTHALLGVDSANPTGASGLYRSLGFEPLYRSVVHELRVEPGKG